MLAVWQDLSRGNHSGMDLSTRKPLGRMTVWLLELAPSEKERKNDGWCTDCQDQDQSMRCGHTCHGSSQLAGARWHQMLQDLPWVCMAVNLSGHLAGRNHAHFSAGFLSVPMFPLQASKSKTKCCDSPSAGVAKRSPRANSVVKRSPVTVCLNNRKLAPGQVVATLALCQVSRPSQML